MIHHQLRYIMLYAASLCMLASCKSGDDSPEDNAEMTFVTEVNSRTEITGSDNITNFPFLVYGDMIRISQQPNQTLLTNFTGEEVRFDNSAGKWVYDKTRLWFPGFQYSFIGLHPSATPNMSGIDYSDSQLKFTYTLPSDFRNTDDLLIATHRRNYFEGKTDAVRFKFGHILSNLNIVVSYNNPTIDASKQLIVNSITFKNIPTKASYSISPAKLTGNSFMTYDWMYGDGTADGWSVLDRGDVSVRFYQLGGGAGMIPNDSKEHPLFSNSSALLLLPNPDNPTEMTISYTTFDNSSPNSRDYEETATIPGGWNAGMSYALKISISQGSVQIGFDVAEWMPGDSTSSIVPRR